MMSIRGGAWYFKPKFARASHRHALDPALRYRYGGFRCVCASDPVVSLRSGSWDDKPRNTRTSYRYIDDDPTNRYDDVGFRCVRG